MTQNDFVVRVRCITYNHAPYIIEALNGFAIQNTSFPFLCTIIDDASTDGESQIITNYLQENFDIQNQSVARNRETSDYYMTFAQHKSNRNCFFAVFFLKYNHKSKKKPKDVYIQDWTSIKYTALCEGDDYWTDPNKLQIQVDFLESHQDFSMCWHDASLLNHQTKQIYGNHRRYKEDTVCPVEDMIVGGGGFCPTASLLFRSELRENAPKELFNQSVGDYPLQLYMSFVGKVFYMDRNMSVYRTNVTGSWTSTYLSNENIDIRRECWMKTLKIYHDFNAFSNYQYNEAFVERENMFLYNEAMRISDFSLARKCWYNLRPGSRPYRIKILLLLHGFGHLKIWISKHSKQEKDKL